MATTFTTAAKFILCGEHFVVTGEPCLAIPAPCFRLRITLYQDATVRGIATQCQFDTEQTYVPEEIAKHERTLAELIEHAIVWFGFDPEDVNLRFVLKSSIPPSQGAGSSSAVCQAVIGVLAKHFGKRPEMPREFLYHLGKMLETWFHGKVSGVDNAVISYGKPVFFIPNESCTIVGIHEPFYFVVGSTGARQAPSPYETVRGIRAADPFLYERGSKEVCAGAVEMLESLRRSDAQRVGELMLSFHRLMQDMGLSTESCDEAVDVAMEVGALGAKVTGAGRGGFVIALAPVMNIEKIQRAWIGKGLQNVRSFCVGDDYRFG